jgi:hypothetical protein
MPGVVVHLVDIQLPRFGGPCLDIGMHKKPNPDVAAFNLNPD